MKIDTNNYGVTDDGYRFVGKPEPKRASRQKWFWLGVTIIAIVGLWISMASAQQQTPNEQALGGKLMQELQAGLVCSASLITAQAQIADLKKQIEEAKKVKPE